MNNLPKINKTTRTTTYKLGKNKVNNNVGILIKNNKTQKKIKQEISLLKKQNIQEVKNNLRKNNLIKAGSDAPNDVLRKLYEDSILSGDITNTNDENLLYNYLNE